MPLVYFLLKNIFPFYLTLFIFFFHSPSNFLSPWFSIWMIFYVKVIFYIPLNIRCLQPLQIISLSAFFAKKTQTISFHDLFKPVFSSSLRFVLCRRGEVTSIIAFNTYLKWKRVGLLYISFLPKSRYFLQHVIVSLWLSSYYSLADRKCYSLCECQQQPIIS